MQRDVKRENGWDNAFSALHINEVSFHLYEKRKVFFLVLLGTSIRFRVHIEAVFGVTATERNQQKQASS